MFDGDVYTGQELKTHIDRLHINDYKKRNCFVQIMDYLNNPNRKVLGLCGLRRTGKTTLMRQAIKELNKYEECALITCSTEDSIMDLKRKIGELDKKYVFIDEVTKIHNFASTCAFLADDLTESGKKIILSGTDSYALILAKKDELFDRIDFIRTTYIPFREFNAVLGKNYDDYLKYGGTMSESGMEYNELDGVLSYVNSSIVNNICYSISCYKNGRHPLYSRYGYEELANMISKIVELHNRDFSLKAVLDEFYSKDIGSLIDLASKRNMDISYLGKDECFQKKIMEAIHVKESIVQIPDQKVINELRNMLKSIDVLMEIPGANYAKPEVIFTQVGLRYAQLQDIKEMICEEVIGIGKLTPYECEVLKNCLEEDIEGVMLEDYIFADLVKDTEFSKTHSITKYSTANGEFDICIIDKNTRNAALLEVKHSTQRDQKQGQHLRKESLVKDFEKEYHCHVIGKYILYNGESGMDFDVEYLNSSDFLLRHNVFKNLEKKLAISQEPKVDKTDDYDPRVDD